MISLLNLAVDTLFGNLGDRFHAWLLNLIMDAISWVEGAGTWFFNSTIVQKTLEFTAWLAWGVFGVAFVILLLDIGEELGGYKPGQGMEFTAIFTNFIKAIAFILMGPRLAVIAMQLAANATGQMSVDYTALKTEVPNMFSLNLGGLLPVSPIIILSAVIGFFCFTLFSAGGIFVQAATAFLYVPDILRGRTTAMGDWMRQTISILITFLFRHILFHYRIGGRVERRLHYHGCGVDHHVRRCQTAPEIRHEFRVRRYGIPHNANGAKRHVYHDDVWTALKFAGRPSGRPALSKEMNF